MTKADMGLDHYMNKLYNNLIITRKQFSIDVINSTTANIYFGGYDGDVVLAQGRNTSQDIVWIPVGSSSDFFNVIFDHAMINSVNVSLKATYALFDSASSYF